MMLKFWIEGQQCFHFPHSPSLPISVPSFLSPIFKSGSLRDLHSNSYHVFDYLPVDALLGHIPAYTKY